MPFKQENRLLAVETPLGKDVLLLAGINGYEAMSRLFNYRLEMFSENDAIAAKDIVGKNVSFRVKLSNGSPRWFNGFVSRFNAGDRETGLRRYWAEVVPWLWFLTRTADCRIFQEKTVPEIIEQIFKDLGFSDYKKELNGPHPKWEYCVQYRETDFNFVSRLAEQEGIFYFFQHEQGKHTLVLADHKGAYKTCPEKEVIHEYSFGTRFVTDRVTSWDHQYEFRPGKWAQTDYYFESPAGSERTPSNILMTKENSVVKLPGIDKYEIYDYPGEYEKKGDGQPETKFRMEEDEAPHDVVSASSTCKTFTPGHKFSLKEHAIQSEKGKTYVITTIRHTATEPATYEGGAGGVQADYYNSFTCIPESVSFRAARITPKPMIHGSQTAVVTGPDGEEIWPDKYGRVLVQFYWDREGKRHGDGKQTSCWIRCMQTMAGKGWGNMWIPRIGQEVIVSYLEGDPDRPLITGLVYNAEQMPPYKLPDEKTKSYIKTNSSKGGDGFNEIRFEDKKDKEQIFIHAERNEDIRVKNDCMERIIHDRHLIVGAEGQQGKAGDQREMVYVDKHLKVHRHQIEHIGGNKELLVGKIDGPGDEDIIICGTKKETIGGENHLHIKSNNFELVDAASHIAVKGVRNEKVGGKQSLTVGGDHHVKVAGKYAVEAAEIHLKANTIIIEGVMGACLKDGAGNFVTVNAAGVAIKGTMVLINSGGSALSGSGSSPTAPTAPKDAKEAKPIEPTVADNSKTGQKSTPF